MGAGPLSHECPSEHRARQLRPSDVAPALVRGGRAPAAARGLQEEGRGECWLFLDTLPWAVKHLVLCLEKCAGAQARQKPTAPHLVPWEQPEMGTW